MAKLKNWLKKIPLLKILIRKYRAYAYITPKINIFKTVYLNFKTQKFKVAIRFPIYVYGKLKIPYCYGDIILRGPIKSGRIKIGYNSDQFSAEKGGAMLKIGSYGQIICYGNFACSVDCLIDVSGTLELKDESFFGNGAKVRCYNHMYFGEKSRIASECQAFDSNFHFTENIYTHEVRRKDGEIIIGDYCWIGNRTSLMKGTVLPDYTIVTSNSLCNKDFTNGAPPAPLIGGIPAKIIGKGGMIRIFDIEKEERIINFFKEHPEVEIYTDKECPDFVI